MKPLQASRERTTRLAASAGCALAGVFILTQVVFSQSAWTDREEGINLDSRVTKGPRLEPVSAGAIWLYYYGWGTLDSLKLADIGQEPVRIVLTTEWRDSMIPPEPATDGCVMAIELPGPVWYRTADVSRTDLLRDLEPLFWALGSRVENPSGPPTLVLPEHPLRVLRFLDLNDMPVVGKQIDLSIYVTDRNHCGHHHGLPLGAFRTDETGEVRLRAPLVDLYLDGLRYFEDEGPGPWGRMFSHCEGLRLGPAPVEVIMEAWNLPEQGITITVNDAEANPVEGLDLVGCERSAECGAHCGSLGRTDSVGTVRATCAPGSMASLTLKSAGTYRPLTDSEIHELFHTGSLTLRFLAP